MKDFNKPYNPQKTEPQIYRLWERSGYFDPDRLPPVGAEPRGHERRTTRKKHRKPFTIIMPPPNANGLLHLGHAVGITLQDIMTRYKRMQGYKTLLLPGADHAGFETQVVYDKKLEKEGRNRFEMPREQLYDKILKFTLKNKKIMEDQVRSLGASCDWSREKFTLDEDIIKIVYQTFAKLKKDGLIYKGQRIVNWCPKHQTSLSDVEIKYEERIDPLYYIKYPLKQVSSSKSQVSSFITVATARPETMLGDTAIAVNPKDKRYKDLIGKTAILPLIKREIPIIADDAIDVEFGTGAVKVTPAHDPVDFDIWQKNQDKIQAPIQMINKFGRMNKRAGVYQGLKIKEAREKIVEELTRQGLIEKTQPDYKHNVSICYKCGTVIEPLILDNQFFVKMTDKPASKKLSLRDMAVQAIKKGEVKFIPKRFEKLFFHWMKNLRDWNISRQIVWGIKIPDESTEDVFDTWFSSGQWPFATLMTTGKNDFKNFYPTDVMETGWDILFFWVARMIMLGIYTTGKMPFHTVYLHGLVRDKDRQKMSKSKGNVIDPLGVIDLYGADALRMALVVGNTPGNDPIIYEEKIRGYRNFTNKIWQATRFVLMNAKGYNNKKRPVLTAEDKKDLAHLKKFSKEITELMDDFKFYSASEKIYHYFWHTFADKIIEQAKPRLRQGFGGQARLTTKDTKDRQAAQYVLLEILKTNIKLLHPFMPFITERIWQELTARKLADGKMLMVSEWPE